MGAIVVEMPAAWTSSPSTTPLIDALLEEHGALRCVAAPDGRILRANCEWLRSGAGGPGDVAGADLSEALQVDRATATALLARVRAGERVAVPRHARRVEGCESWWQGEVAPVEMGGGTGFLVTLRELCHGELRYRQLFENMRDGFAYCRMLFDGQGRPADFVYLDVNDAFARLTGLHDVIGKRVSEVIPGIREAEPELMEAYGRIARGGDPERLEIHFRPLDMWLSISAYSPRPDHFVALFDNVTERKRSEQAHERDRRVLESITRATDVMLVYLDPDFNFVRVNDAYAAACHKRPEDLIGKNHFALYPNEENERIFRRVRESGGTGLLQGQALRVPGSARAWGHVLGLEPRAGQGIRWFHRRARLLAAGDHEEQASGARAARC
jgi:PAS domain S-box-containing protein